MLTVVMVDGGCGSLELGGGEESGSSLDSDLVDIGDELGGFGTPKKDVRDACALGFLEVELAMSAALRFNGVAMTVVPNLPTEYSG